MQSFEAIQSLTNTVETLHQYLVSELKNIRVDIVTNNESRGYLIGQIESLSKEGNINREKIEYIESKIKNISELIIELQKSSDNCDKEDKKVNDDKQQIINNLQIRIELLEKKLDELTSVKHAKCCAIQ